MPNDVPERARFGPYEVDLHTHELWKHGLRLKVVGQPFEILAVLLARPGELITREELRAKLWPGDTFVDFNHGLNAAVNKLREALSDSAEEPRYIETLPRRGYRFIAQVEPVARSIPARIPDAQVAAPVEPLLPAAAAVLAPAAAPAVTPVEAVAGNKSPKQRRKLRILIPVAVLGLLLVAWMVIRRHGSVSGDEIFGNLSGVAQSDLLPLTDLPDPASDPAFSPDGNRVAFRRQGYSPGTSGIFVKAIGTLELRQLTNNPGDCCPVWSPDGRSIAFSRYVGKEREIDTIPATGGDVRHLCSTRLGPKRGELDWSPDGAFIAFTGESQAGASGIFVVSLKDGGFRSITQPPPLNKDWGAVFSPDGQSLAFIRTRETGLPEMIMVMPAGGGETRVLFSHNNGIVGPPAWAADSQSLLFATGEPNLLRISVTGGEPSQVPQVHGPAWRPAVSRKGYRLAYQKISRAVSTVQLDLDPAAKPQFNPVVTSTGPGSTEIRFSESPAMRPHGIVVTDTGRNEGAQVSPDGKKLAFMSNRSGSMEIWMSDRDGSNAIQMTAMGVAGTPRWSPDGRSIVFDRDTGENGGIFILHVDGGAPTALVQDSARNLVPSVSQDGKWVYFASDRAGSDRSGTWQVWKVPFTGGSPIQVTIHGGFAAYESHDGKYLYYSKFNMPNPEVWKMPVGGGPETRVSSLLRPETWANWALADRGIFFIATGASGDPALMYLDFTSGDVKHLSTLDKMPFWLSATPDGKSILFEHLDQENSHVMLLENFR